MVDLSTQVPPSSGDLVSCDSIPFEFEELPTTKPTILAEITTESPIVETTGVTSNEISTEEMPTEEPQIIVITPPDENLVELVVMVNGIQKKDNFLRKFQHHQRLKW